MLFRTPGRAFLAGLALAVALAAQLRPAFEADVAAFRAALSSPKRPAPPPKPAPAPEPAQAMLVSAPTTKVSDPADPFASPAPEPAFARLGAAVQPLVYRVEPGEEPLVPQAAPPEEVVEAAHRPEPPDLATRHPPGHFLPVRWEEDDATPSAAPAALPAQTRPEELARAAYAALDAGALGNAALLFEMALSARPSAQLAADLAYARLRLGQRREAAAAFETALRLGSAAPEAGALWQREASRLNDRVSLQAYTFLREDGSRPSSAPFATGTPGQSQSALLLQVRPDPLARRPLLLVGRVLAAHHGPGDSPLLHSAQATAGIGWVAAPAVNGTVVAERWVKLGDGSRGAWALRAHGGHGEGYGPTSATTSGWVHWSVFGEAAVIGTHRRDLYAGAEARAGYGHAFSPRTRATLTGALWGQIQHDDATRHRLEAGPSLALETALGPLPLHLRLDYRFALSPARAASGATLTAATGF